MTPPANSEDLKWNSLHALHAVITRASYIMYIGHQYRAILFVITPASYTGLQYSSGSIHRYPHVPYIGADRAALYCIH